MKTSPASSLLVLIALLTACSRPGAQSVPAVESTGTPQQRSQSILRNAMAAHNIPGLSIAVGKGGNIIWAEGFGSADLSARHPVTPDTRFRIGTASTQLTAAALLSLNQQIPTTPNTDDASEEPLFRQRCEHPDANSSNPWIRASATIESVSRQPFLTYMNDHLFRPLNMTQTGAQSSTEENPEHIGEPEEDAPPMVFLRNVLFIPIGFYKPTPRPLTDPATLYQASSRPIRPRNFSCYAGALAFYSTPSDLLRFQRSHPITTLQGQLIGQRVLELRTLTEPGIHVAILTNAALPETANLSQKIAAAFQ